MKKALVVAALVVALFGFAFAFAGGENAGDGSSYLRIHIRANSNSEEDQRVKYLVRDEIVKFLAPTAAQCTGKEEALSRIGEQLPAAEKVAARTLEANGFFYGARASLRREEFPTRVYENVTLPAGVYDALIVELGAGEGDNWWCVVYPPLCFTGGNVPVVYKSKIAELIRSFFGE